MIHRLLTEKAIAGFISYFLTYYYHGFEPGDLLWTSFDYFKVGAEDIVASDNRIYVPIPQLLLTSRYRTLKLSWRSSEKLRHLSLLLLWFPGFIYIPFDHVLTNCRMGCVIACKTRRLSLLKQGMR